MFGWHTLSFLMRKGDQTSSDKGCDVYFDDVFVSQLQRPYNVANLLTSFIVSNHIVGNGYVESTWLATPDGYSMEVDWVRIWKRPGAKHYKPLTTVPSVNVDFGQQAVITLPSKSALWGEDVADDHEVIMSVMHEENEPYGSHTTLYGLLPNPSGTTNDPVVDKTARTITLPAAVLNRPGRLNMIGYAKADGCVSEAARFAVNVGPHISVTGIDYEVGVPFSFDLYHACDCGVLTTNGVSRAKTISVSGLPVWATYNDATGLVTGTPTDTGTATLSVTVTNSIGQTATGTISLAKKATAVSSWATDFNVANANLEDAGLGLTRLDGSTGGLRIVSNALRGYDSTSAGTMYLAPQLSTGNHFIQGNIIANSDNALCVRVTDRNNHFQLRRNTDTLLQVYRRVGGTMTLQASFTLGTALVATDVVRLTDFGSTLGVKLNGVALSPSTGTLTITTAPPASDREGIVSRNSSGTQNFLDNAAGGIE